MQIRIIQIFIFVGIYYTIHFTKTICIARLCLMAQFHFYVKTLFGNIHRSTEENLYLELHRTYGIIFKCLKL